MCHHTDSAAWEEIRERLRERDDEGADERRDEAEPPIESEERPDAPTPPADD